MINPPIIIIGAGRSGTNILRDSICSLKGFETWPCDEINYIWRHRNVRNETDRFTQMDARPGVMEYIEDQFEKLEDRTGAEYVVEKTCANSLRIPFINAIFPDARFIFLIRDGRDVASSARQRWTAPLELKYIWKKVRYVPISDMPYYGFRYFINRIKKLVSKEKRLAFWGPIYPGMFRDLENDSLIEVCAKQWKACVETADHDLSMLNKARVHRMKYESFVQNPVEEMKRVMKFLGVEATEDELAQSVGNVSPKSIGNYTKYLSEDELVRINKIIEPVMNYVYARNN